MDVIRICPQEDRYSEVAKHLNVYYKGYELKQVYACEITEHMLQQLLDKVSEGKE